METIEILDVILEPKEVSRIEHLFEYEKLISEDIKGGYITLPFIVYKDQNNDVYLFDKELLDFNPGSLTDSEYEYLKNELLKLLDK